MVELYSTMVSSVRLVALAPISTVRTLRSLVRQLLTQPTHSNRTVRASSTTCVTSGYQTRVRMGGVCVRLALLTILASSAITRTDATSASSSVVPGGAGPGYNVGYSALLRPYYLARATMENTNACALPGVCIEYDTFLPAMRHAVSTGHVNIDHTLALSRMD